ncbi:MAG: hypothetical protein NTW21_10355 [Verrucomicrobia bacterium]|nr:hypothetical protein [Verrucomicrobiota bacterium]
MMIPEGAAAPTLPLTVQLTASQIPSITITSEDKTLEYAGLAHTSLGNATLDVIDNKLTVSNLGSSGQDGVGIALPAELSAWEAHWQDLDPGGMLPVGAYLKQQVIGTGGTVTNGVLGTVQVTKENVGNYTISADFSPLGSNTRTVQVYRGSTLVAEVTGQSGALCATSVSISGSASVGWWPLYLDVDFNVSVNISIGGTTYLGDRVVMIPEGAAAPTLPLTVQLTASQIPSITITSEDAAGGYATWTRLQGLTPANNGPAQDPEADGIINLMEFYLNGNPLALDRSILPTATLDADYLTLRFKRLDAAELEMTQQAVQFGASLTSWSASVIGPVSSPPDGNGVIVTVSENGADPDDITVQIPRSKAIAGQLFGRLQIGK